MGNEQGSEALSSAYFAPFFERAKMGSRYFVKYASVA